MKMARLSDNTEQAEPNNHARGEARAENTDRASLLIRLKRHAFQPVIWEAREIKPIGNSDEADIY